MSPQAQGKVAIITVLLPNLNYLTELGKLFLAT